MLNFRSKLRVAKLRPERANGVTGKVAGTIGLAQVNISDADWMVQAEAYGTEFYGGGPGNPGNLYHVPGKLPPYDPKIQVGGTCVFYTTAEIYDYYTCSSITGLNALAKYVKNKTSTDREFDKMWDNLSDNGIVLGNAFPTFFLFSSTSNIAQSLVNGFPVAATIQQPGGATKYLLRALAIL